MLKSFDFYIFVCIFCWFLLPVCWSWCSLCSLTYVHENLKILLTFFAVLENYHQSFEICNLKIYGHWRRNILTTAKILTFGTLLWKCLYHTDCAMVVNNNILFTLAKTKPYYKLTNKYCMFVYVILTKLKRCQHHIKQYCWC